MSRRSEQGKNGPIALTFHILFLVFMVAPLVVVCLVAFTPEGYLSLPVRGPSLRWFRAILASPEFIRSFHESLWLGMITSTLALALAVASGLAISRYRFRGREALLALMMSPLMIPHVVLGVAFLRFFTELHLSGSFVSLVASHVVIVFPLVLRLVLVAFSGLDRRIEDAATSLSARPLTVFRRVTLPLVMSGAVSGWVLAFITSFDELSMTVFVASPTNVTLPVRLFLYIQDNIDPLVCSISAVIILGTALLMLLIDRLFGIDRLFIGSGME
jgi:putative spermidine/putrescine transport system permease protein